MGDLISREYLLKAFAGFNDTENGGDFLNGLKSAAEIVENAPTAYDLEKVVEQLEEHKRVARDGVQSYDCVSLVQAIKIVKGGVRNG